MSRLETKREDCLPRVGRQYPGGQNQPTRRSALSLLLQAGLIAGCAKRLGDVQPVPEVTSGKPLAAWDQASPIPAPGSADRVNLNSASDLLQLASMRPGVHYV